MDEEEIVLKCETFVSHNGLCDFVNNNNITSENIERILVNNRYVLFYWEKKNA